MGRTENGRRTYPRLADVIGFIPKDRLVAATEAVMSVQRDYGNRAERTRARFKYTIDDKGLDWIKARDRGAPGRSARAGAAVRFHLQRRRVRLARDRERPLQLHPVHRERPRRRRGDRRSWTALRAIAAVHKGTFRLTPNQNLIIADVAAEDRPAIEALLAEHGLAAAARERAAPQLDRLRGVADLRPRHGRDRALPARLSSRIEAILAANGLDDEPITIRMSGCPNGCSRPYVAEIALTGRAPGKYNLYLGGGFHGQRLNRMYLENVGEAAILELLDGSLGRYASERRPASASAISSSRYSYLASEQQVPGRISPII